MAGMKLSPRGLEFIKEHEGCKLLPYQDEAGVWTVGYGSTINVTPGEQISAAEAESRLVEDLRDAENCVNYLARVPLQPWQYDALVSLVFNIGCGNFRASTLLRKLLAGDIEGAADEFHRWNKITEHGTGRKIENAGLTARRKLEAEMFENLA